jgi:Ca2+-binding RTX toxin-like protein
LLLPTSAHAASVAVKGGQLEIEASAGELNKVTVTESASAFQVTDSGVAITPGAGCSGSGNTVSCARSGAQKIFVLLRDGEDTFELTGTTPVKLDGGEGDDVIRGGGGADDLTGAVGNDTLKAEAGDDMIYASDGTDSLEGGAGADFLDGGSGPDTIVAGEGDDTLKGGTGDDQLEPGKGSDSMDAGEGNDRVLAAEGEFRGTSEKFISCGNGTDSLRAGPADWFPDDCEVIDGPSIRLRKGGVVPLRVACLGNCRVKLKITDAKRRITGSAGFSAFSSMPQVVNVKLSPKEVKRLFKLKKVRMTLTFGGVRATFTLLRRV